MRTSRGLELVLLEFSACSEDHNYDQVTSVQYIFTVGEKRLLAPLWWHHGQFQP